MHTCLVVCRRRGSGVIAAFSHPPVQDAHPVCRAHERQSIPFVFGKSVKDMEDEFAAGRRAVDVLGETFEANGALLQGSDGFDEVLA